MARKRTCLEELDFMEGVQAPVAVFIALGTGMFLGWHSHKKKAQREALETQPVAPTPQE